MSFVDSLKKGLFGSEDDYDDQYMEDVYKRQPHDRAGAFRFLHRQLLHLRRLPLRLKP